jgi:hypothetical protein
MEHLQYHLLTMDWPQQVRKNVLDKDQVSYDGFILGQVHSWAGKKPGKTGRCIVISRKTETPKYKIIWEMARKIMNEYDPDFKFTTIQFNKNHKMKKHLDKNNVGCSYIVGLGNYEGGELRIWNERDEDPKDIDIKNKFYKFNGYIHYHETQDFTGDRISLVFFTV